MENEDLNKGFDPGVIEEYRRKIAASGLDYIVDEEDENSEEYVHFYFIGTYEEKEVIYDAVIYTLRLHHESEMYEIAEHRAAKHFPEYKKINYEEDENGNLETLEPLEEEIGLFMAEVIMELEEEESVKVQEHIELDKNAEFGISLDIGLHREQITSQVIQRFIKDYNNDTLVLDKTFYSYQIQDEEI
jgi:hypothetical protein